MDLIKGQHLTTWSITADGAHVRLGLVDDNGRPCAVVLPIAVLSGLMMTIPRMLQDALRTRFSDGSLRMIHELGDWRVERAAGTDASILSLATPDGFEVAFAVATPQADKLGKTLRHSATPGAEEMPVLN